MWEIIGLLSVVASLLLYYLHSKKKSRPEKAIELSDKFRKLEEEFDQKIIEAKVDDLSDRLDELEPHLDSILRVTKSDPKRKPTH